MAPYKIRQRNTIFKVVVIATILSVTLLYRDTKEHSLPWILSGIIGLIYSAAKVLAHKDPPFDSCLDLYRSQEQPSHAVPLSYCIKK